MGHALVSSVLSVSHVHSENSVVVVVVSVLIQIKIVGTVPVDHEFLLFSVAEPEPVEPKLFCDLEPEPELKINFYKHFLQSVWRMLG